MVEKAPCEKMVKFVLPAIRAEMARTLVKEYNLPQQNVAKVLGVTNAAISQYLSERRGAEVELPQDVVLYIKKYAKKILSGDFDEDYLCEICRVFQKSLEKSLEKYGDDVS
ncbi:transcriptional regulator [Methanosarcinales archaeon]|nr:MAG: transcriptional regulator [Methanosarcinales archaeon]